MNNTHHYHISLLTKQQQNVYTLMRKTLTSLSSSVDLSNVSVVDLSKAHEALLLDCPDIFYNTEYQYTQNGKGDVIKFTPKYNYPIVGLSQYKAMVESSIAFFTSAKNKNDYEKVLLVHDYVLDKIRYDYQFVPESHNILGVVKNRQAVCEGIAKFVKLVFDRLFIKCIVVVGHALNPDTRRNGSEPHAWNMVEINGAWYSLDVTFDLTLTTKRKRYDYFLVRDEQLIKSHKTNIVLPKIGIQNIDYYTIHGMTVSNLSQLGSYVKKTLDSGQKTITFKLNNAPRGIGIDETNSITKIIQEQCGRIFYGTFYINMRYNNTMQVYEINITP